MAGDAGANSRSVKDLWVLLSGVSKLKSKELVRTELQKNEVRLLDGILYYKPPNAASAAALTRDKNIDGAQLDFVQKLSKFLELDEVQCYDIFCSFLLYEYKGSQSGLQNTLTSDRHVQNLMFQIWKYYQCERIFLLLCLKQIVSHWLNEKHPYNEIYKEFMDPLKRSGIIPDKLLTQFELVCALSVPAKDTHGRLMVESQISKWVVYNLKQQCELLQILLLYHKSIECTSGLFLRQLTLFQKHGFGRRQTFKHLVDDNSETLLDTICHLETVLIVENMELEWLIACQDESVTEHYLLKDPGVWKEVDDIMCSLGLAADHSPIILGWMLIRFAYLEDKQLLETRRLGHTAHNHGVYAYLYKMLKQPFFGNTSVVAGLGHTVVYGLVSSVLSTFQLHTLGKIEDLLALAGLLLKHANISQDTWEKGFETGLGLLIQRAKEWFPYNFHTLLQLVTAIAASGGVDYNKVIGLLTQLPCFTDAVDNLDRSPSFALGDEENSWQLTVSYMPLYSETFVIPQGTTGRVLEQLDKNGRSVMQWEFVTNGWDVCNSEADNLLQHLTFGAGQVTMEMISKVLLVGKLVCSLIKSDVRAIGNLSPFIEKLQDIFQRFCSVPNPPMSLLAVCMEAMAHTAHDKPQLVWQCLSQMGIMPFINKVDPDVPKLASGIDMNIGIFGSLIAAQECVTGTYPLTLAFISLISNSAEAMLESSDGTFFACELFLLHEVFPFFHKWRYRKQKDLEMIGQGCLDVIHKLLTVSNPNGTPREQSLPQQICIHSLLHYKAGQSLLLLAATGEDNLEAALEQLTSWCADSGSALCNMVRLSLSVLNRLMLLKPPAPNGKEQLLSPLERYLCSQSADPSQPHIVLTVAYYGFHRYDPRLATLAIVLLQHFARELNVSLLACLGNDADAIRDSYLVRLESPTEDIRLKTALLEFLTVCVNAQPGLLEMFINMPIQTTNDKELEKDQSSCLLSVVGILQERKEGIYPCPANLHCAAVEFLHALWVGWRNVAMCILKKNSSFWTWLCDPLLDRAQIGESNQVASYVMKILALEIYYSNVSDSSSSTEGHILVLKQLCTGSYIADWSQTVQRVLTTSEKFDTSIANTSLTTVPDKVKGAVLMLTAWRDFLIVIAKHLSKILNSDQKRFVVTDLMESLLGQCANSINPKIVVLLSEVLLLLMHNWKRDCIDDLELWCGHIGDLLSLVATSPEDVMLRALIAITSTVTLFLQILQSEKNAKQCSRVMSLWVPSVCSLIKFSTLNVTRITDCDVRSPQHQLPMVCISLLKELIVTLGDPSLWLSSLLQHLTLNSVLHTMSACMRVHRGADLVSAILVLFLSLALIPESSQVLSSSDMMQHLCLPLSFTYAHLNQAVEFPLKHLTVSKKETSPWLAVYENALKLVLAMLKTQEHFFFEDALNFVGVHMDRMMLSLINIQMSLNPAELHTTFVTLNFINQLSCYKESWKIHHQASLKMLLEAVCSVSQASVAYLIRPNFIQHLVEHQPRMGGFGGAVLEEERQRIRRLSSTEDVEKPSPQLLHIQTKLLQIVSVSLATLRHFTPDLCEIILDKGIDTSQWEPVLDCGFSTPVIENNAPVNFGSMVSCVNVCLRALTKNERAPSPGRMVQPPEASLQVERQLLVFVLENALVLLMSQALLHLLSPSLTIRDKQLIKRELGTELNSFAMSMNRYLRRGVAHSPASTSSLPSPVQPQGQLSPGSQPFVRLITSLVDKLFK